MQIQVQPDYLIFADEAKTGELTDFPNIARGWGITIDQTQSKPPMEWMNGAFNRIDKNTLYLLQQGIPEWHKTVLYPINAVIKYKGILYQAIIENDNAIPTTNTTKWRKLIEEASLSQKGIVQLSSAIDSDSEITAATSKAVKEVAELANKALPLTGGTVTGDTNFTGKLQQASSNVITEETIDNYTAKTVVLYPDGSEDTPATLTADQRIVISNPFKTRNVIISVELFINNIWAEGTDLYHFSNQNSNVSAGVTASTISDHEIVITTGVAGMTQAQAYQTPWFSSKPSTLVVSAPYRIRLTKLGVQNG